MAKSEKFDLRIRAKDEATPTINKVKGSVKAFAVSLAVAAAAAAAFLKSAIQAAAETEIAYAGLAGAVERSGAVWEAVQEPIRRFTGEMQALTGVADETFARGIEMFINYGLTAREAFETVRVVTDVAIAQNVKLKGQFRFFTEALGNNVTSLKKYGVTLDVTTSNAEQFRSAIQQIGEQFSGSAESRRETAATQFASMSQSWGDFMEAIGQFATSSGAIDSLRELTVAINDMRVTMFGTEGSVETLELELKGLQEQFDKNVDVLKRLDEAFKKGLKPPIFFGFTQSFTELIGKMGQIKVQIDILKNASNEALEDINKTFSQLRMPDLDIPTPADFDFGPDDKLDLRFDTSDVRRDFAEYSAEWVQTINDNANLWSNTTSQMSASFSTFTDSLVDNMFGARLELQEVFKGIAADFLKFVLDEILRATAKRAAFSILNAIIPGFGSALSFGSSTGGVQVPFAPVTAGVSGGPAGKIININIEGNVIESTQFVRETLIPALQEANAFDIESFGPRG